jgi:hypothetical protein
MLVEKPVFQSQYSDEDNEKFHQYFKKRISEFKDLSGDGAKLFLKIYANPVKNTLRYQSVS